jgi:phosphatidylglycerophosphate synthase
MNKIPNILSISRAITALLIPFTGNHKYLFLTVILFCGLTDVLDGYLARRWNCQSEFGSRLDSLGDWMMGLAITAYLLIWQMHLINSFMGLIIAIIGVRVISLMISYLKNHKVYSIHTLLNKATGFIVFIGICLIPLYKQHPEMFFVFGMALLSALEELFIFLVAKTPDPDLKSLFHLRKPRI